MFIFLQVPSFKTAKTVISSALKELCNNVETIQNYSLGRISFIFHLNFDAKIRSPYDCDEIVRSYCDGQVQDQYKIYSSGLISYKSCSEPELCFIVPFVGVGRNYLPGTW